MRDGILKCNFTHSTYVSDEPTASILMVKESVAQRKISLVLERQNRYHGYERTDRKQCPQGVTRFDWKFNSHIQPTRTKTKYAQTVDLNVRLNVVKMCLLTLETKHYIKITDPLGLNFMQFAIKNYMNHCRIK